MISRGKWAPGEKIPGEIALSEQFQVSRNSVRESIKALEIVGLLVSRPGRGTFVSESAPERVRLIRYHATLDAADIEAALIELVEARLIVEPGLCWFAARFGTDKDFSEMESIVDRSLDAVDHKEYHFELGMAFHEYLYIMSDNLILKEMFGGMKEKFVIARREVYFRVNTKETLVKELYEHKKILDLIKARNGSAAAEKMRAHLEKPLMRLRELFRDASL